MVSGVTGPMVAGVAVAGSVMIVIMTVAVYMVFLGMVPVTFVATVMILTRVCVVPRAVGILLRVIMSLGVRMAPG